MDFETALKIGNAFGGGIGKTGQTCGAVTGAVMVISLKYGTVDADDKDSKEKAYNLTGKFMREFEIRNKSSQCRDLIGFDISDDSYPDKGKIIMEKCPAFLKDAAEIIEDIFKESRNQ